MKLKKILVLLLVGVLSISLLVGCTNKPAEDEKKPDTEKQVTDKPVSQEPEEETELLISAAASMTDVLNEIAQMYNSVDPSTKLIYTFGSSGALQTQIEEGAPVDIFMSAAQKQMTALEEKDLIIKETNKTLLVNKVVLIIPVNSDLALTSFEDLNKDDVKKIGLGDPASVPVGEYSEEILVNLNILEEIKPRSVYGSDVRTVLTWVESGEVDCGIVYATDASSTDKVKVVTQAPEGSHKEVTYPVAVIKDSKNVDKAKAFLDYLSTDEAAEVFVKYGFVMK